MPKAEALSIGAIDLILLRILPTDVEDCASLQHHYEKRRRGRHPHRHTSALTHVNDDTRGGDVVHERVVFSKR